LLTPEEAAALRVQAGDTVRVLASQPRMKKAS
jgi:arginine N-succinyltransferase